MKWIICKLVCVVCILTFLVSCTYNHTSAEETLNLDSEILQNGNTESSDYFSFSLSPPSQSSSYPPPFVLPSTPYDYKYVPEGFHLMDFSKNPNEKQRSIINSVFSEELQMLRNEKNDPTYELDMLLDIMDVNKDGADDLILVVYGTLFHGVHSCGALYVIISNADNNTAIYVGQGTLGPNSDEVEAWLYCKRNEKDGWLSFYFNGCVYEYFYTNSETELAGYYDQTTRYFYW